MATKDTKKTQRQQAFKSEYSIIYPFMRKHSDTHAFCTICRGDFGVDHSGVNDIKKHVYKE